MEFIGSGSKLLQQLNTATTIVPRKLMHSEFCSFVEKLAAVAAQDYPRVAFVKCVASSPPGSPTAIDKRFIKQSLIRLGVGSLMNTDRREPKIEVPQQTFAALFHLPAFPETIKAFARALKMPKGSYVCDSSTSMLLSDEAIDVLLAEYHSGRRYQVLGRQRGWRRVNKIVLALRFVSLLRSRMPISKPRQTKHTIVLPGLCVLFIARLRQRALARRQQTLPITSSPKDAEGLSVAQGHCERRGRDGTARQQDIYSQYLKQKARDALKQSSRSETHQDAQQRFEAQAASLSLDVSQTAPPSDASPTAPQSSDSLILPPSSAATTASGSALADTRRVRFYLCVLVAHNTAANRVCD
eukprot:GHVU01041434.1.p1 GENE.GHVU01041434.1~~GHVU01041434.1.p1  ORF type:complete len:355 (-),score=24.05 GHVU01041434.1:92-1156(-)